MRAMTMGRCISLRHTPALATIVMPIGGPRVMMAAQSAMMPTLRTGTIVRALSVLEPDHITSVPSSKPTSSSATTPSAPPIVYPFQPKHGASHPSQTLIANATAEDSREQFVYIHDPWTQRDYYLVGTIHTRAASCIDVKQVIDLVRPGSIMVELDAERAASLSGMVTGTHRRGAPSSVFWSPDRDKTASIGSKIVSWQAERFYADMEKEHGIVSGAEFKVAMDEAHRRGAQLVYGDETNGFLDKAGGGLRGLRWWFAMRRASEEQASYAVHTERAPDGSRIPTKDAVERSSLRRGVNRAYRDRLRVNSPSLAQAMFDDREAVLFDALVNKCVSNTVVGVVGAMHLTGLEDLFLAYLTRQQQQSPSPPRPKRRH